MESCWIITLIAYIGLFLKINGNPCNLRHYPHGYVCVCNETYCDSYEDIVPPNAGHYLLASSSQGGLMFNIHKGSLNKFGTTKIFIKDHNEQESKNQKTMSFKLKLIQEKLYQKIIGFGGALTGSVSHILEYIKPELKKHIFNSYYSGTKGIAYNMMRWTIGGCDFDKKPWAYAEEPAYDRTLSGFTKLNEEDLIKIKQYRELEELTNNYEIKNVAAAWSSPRWMKTNDAWNGVGYLLPQYYQTWANYNLRWLGLMKMNNMSIWAISTGNEPQISVVNFKYEHILSLPFNAYQLGIYLGENFGPLLRSSEFKDVKIITFTDNRLFLPWFLNRMNIGYYNATDYADGVGIHWYTDAIVPAKVLTETHNNFPDKFIIYTESCWASIPIMGEWFPAEIYVLDMILSFLNFNQGWIDWNLILNERGGPSYLHKGDDAAILVNMTSRSEFYKQPIYYAIGHFSKFLPPDSVRIMCESNAKIFAFSSVAFIRPDGVISVIIYNNLENRADIRIKDGNGIYIVLSVPAKSVHSLMYLA